MGSKRKKQKWILPSRMKIFPSMMKNKVHAKRKREKKAREGQDPRRQREASPQAPQGGSEQEEIAILEGIIKYRNEKKSEPYKNMGKFHIFLKKSMRISGEELTAQVMDKMKLLNKIAILKEKFENVEKGDDTMLSNHQSKLFDLWNKIWGNADTKTEKKCPPTIVRLNTALALAEKWVSDMEENESIKTESRLARLEHVAKGPRSSTFVSSDDPLERELHAKSMNAQKSEADENAELTPTARDDNDDEDRKTSVFQKIRPANPVIPSSGTKKRRK